MKMSYRIHIGLIKKKELDEFISNHDRSKEDSWEKRWDFLSSKRDIEIFDSTPIDEFKIIPSFEDEEYEPHILNKKDFQRLLDFYKKHLMESHKDKQTKLNLKGKEAERELLNSLTFHHHIEYYFKSLLKRNKNMGQSGLFLLDYFYLVRMYDNWKNGDRAIITHG